MSVEIDHIGIRIGTKDIYLTLTEARELQAALNGMLRSDANVFPYPYTTTTGMQYVGYIGSNATSSIAVPPKG